MDALVQELVNFGPGGVVAAIFAFLWWKKDQQVKELYETNTKRMEKMVERYHKATADMSVMVKTLMDHPDE